MIDLPALKDALRISVVDATTHDVLTQLEQHAVAFVEAQTDRRFTGVETTTDYLTGNGTRTLELRSNASKDVTYFIVTERAYPGGDPTVIAEDGADGYVLRTPTPRVAYLVRKGGSVWRDGYEYEVTYDHGYDPGAEPGDIRQLVIDLVAVQWGLRGDAAGGAVQGETFDRYSYRLADFSDGDLAAIPGAAATIHSWRRPVFA